MTARIDPDGRAKVEAHLRAAEEAVATARAYLHVTYDDRVVSSIQAADTALDAASWAYAEAVIPTEETAR